MNTWPSRFPDMDTAEKFERKPEKIANKVYSGRMGNTEDGDGAKYIGRGLDPIDWQRQLQGVWRSDW
jgi:putative chitinase